jgi:hypothetical protein
MAYEKILILESTWADTEADYIRDSRSTARIYSSFEALQSLRDRPVFAIHRPLLAHRYLRDMAQFVALPANRKGVNLIILSSHGSFRRIEKGNKLVNVRRLHAIDGEVKLSKDIHSLKGELSRTVFILDACDVGASASAFQHASGALAVLGFSKTVDWVDSAAFVLALLLHMQSEGILHEAKASPKPIGRLVKRLRTGAYRSMAKALGLQFASRERPSTG